MQIAFAKCGIVGVLIGAMVTGWFTVYGPLRLEKDRSRAAVARDTIDAIKEVRTASILRIDHLEGALVAVSAGHEVDFDEFRKTSLTYLQRVAEAKFAHTTFFYQDSSLLECLREADQLVQRDIAPQGTDGVGEDTYMALRRAFAQRALLTPVLTAETKASLWEIWHRDQRR